MRRQWPLALVLVTIVLSGCARAQAPTRITPRLTPSSDTLGVRLAMAPVAAVVFARPPAFEPKPFRFRHCYDQSVGWPSALFVVNGKAIGRRADGTVDSVATQRWLKRVDPRQIVSIEVVKSEEAVERYGPAAQGGALLFETSGDTSRTRNRPR